MKFGERAIGAQPLHARPILQRASCKVAASPSKTRHLNRTSAFIKTRREQIVMSEGRNAVETIPTDASIMRRANQYSPRHHVFAPECPPDELLGTIDHKRTLRARHAADAIPLGACM